MVLLRIAASWSDFSFDTSRPSRKYWPDVGLSRQPRMFMVVDLPDPDGPIMATNSPFSTTRSMP